ncbi:MAG: hypothetical protein QMD07_04455 [Thermodesulfovibrionales bacterium]|nr:hypothetical protein [Thermodesulfovibrionales bacterium]
MSKKVVIAAMLTLALVYSGGCKKKEQQPVPKAPAMPQGMGVLQQEQAVPQGHQMMTGGKLEVVVPANVKGKWDSVRFVVENKETKKTEEYTVKLNSEWKVPASNLKVTVGEFLPDFIMNGSKITSGSGSLNNPAVGIKIMDGDKQIFPAPGKQWGWLWSRKDLQSAHPFEHPRFNIMLKEPVKK